ncbi:hypothetical protein [Buchnera aphidicola]|uniref:hypothetical protein n=1 Tax=Buchnera aphidicola TaxID=9 RepID=UPI0021CA74C7|nr:hypothetical protein [Buchnera aphidicola]
MKSEKYKSILIKGLVDKFTLKTSENLIIFPGCTNLVNKSSLIKSKFSNFENLKIGDALFLNEFFTHQLLTKLYSRFNETSLVLEI